MALATTERNTTFRINELPAICFTDAANQPVVGAGEIILKGTLAMKVGPNVLPVVADVGEDPAVLLGIAQETYDNGAGEAGLHMRMVFRRGQCFVENTPGLNEIGTGQIGFDVDLVNNYSVSQTGGDLTVRCVGLSEDGKMVEIWIP